MSIDFTKASREVRMAAASLMNIKLCDARLTTLDQALSAEDKGIHIGGAFSALGILCSLYFGGYINVDPDNPTAPGQDMFVLSKGHAVAAMATVYADMGYFDRSLLSGSRGVGSILNGHPGPILPGVSISTGPLGQGLCAAQGFALASKAAADPYDVYAMVGDGELQEGPAWEAVMYAPTQKLDNLCLLVDRNYGQLDDTRKLFVPMDGLEEQFAAFGWRVISTDSRSIENVMEALSDFRFGERDGRPTVIIFSSVKGWGGYDPLCNKHKINVTEEFVAAEKRMQQLEREAHVEGFTSMWNELCPGCREELIELAKLARLDLKLNDGQILGIMPSASPCKHTRAPQRTKRIEYDAADLPQLKEGESHTASSIVTKALTVFARSGKVYSVDSDLSSTSGLYAGVNASAPGNAYNVGIAEANMMNVAESFAVMGGNVFCSTFCPFFDWKVLRRIAVGQQERLEAMEEGGWLSEGHGLDITFLATAPNFETATNGATHMGNDDNMFFDAMAGLKIIDVACPQQLLSVLKWIMQGDKGLVYLRIPRAASKVLYPSDYEFEFSKAYELRAGSDAVIITSGRGMYEAVEASAILAEQGVSAGVVDMASFDKDTLIALYGSGKKLIFAEQNNGFLWRKAAMALINSGLTVDSSRLMAINTLSASGEPQFVHSATYPQLAKSFDLDAASLAARVKAFV